METVLGYTISQMPPGALYRLAQVVLRPFWRDRRERVVVSWGDPGFRLVFSCDEPVFRASKCEALTLVHCPGEEGPCIHCSFSFFWARGRSPGGVPRSRAWGAQGQAAFHVSTSGLRRACGRVVVLCIDLCISFSVFPSCLWFLWARYPWMFSSSFANYPLYSITTNSGLNFHGRNI